MRLHAEDPLGMYYSVIDKDTDKIIEWCYCADDETGEYEVIVIEDGHAILLNDGNVKTEKRKGNIEFRKIYDKDIEG